MKKLLNRRKGAEPEVTEETRSGEGRWVVLLGESGKGHCGPGTNEIPVGVEQAVCHVHEITGAVLGPQEGVRQVGKIAESSYRVP